MFLYPSSYIWDPFWSVKRTWILVEDREASGLPGGRTSCDRVELPHPSMRTLDDLSGTISRRMSAMSLYDLNQSKDESSDSLPAVRVPR